MCYSENYPILNNAYKMDRKVNIVLVTFTRAMDPVFIMKRSRWDNCRANDKIQTRYLSHKLYSLEYSL